MPLTWPLPERVTEVVQLPVTVSVVPPVIARSPVLPDAKVRVPAVELVPTEVRPALPLANVRFVDVNAPLIVTGPVAALVKVALVPETAPFTVIAALLAVDKLVSRSPRGFRSG